MTTVSYTKLATEFSLVVEELPPLAVQYLLQYGFAQSLQDSVAGRAKAVREELFQAESAKFQEANPKATEEEIEEHLDAWGEANAETIADQVDLAVLAAMGKRMDAIKAGTVATRGAAEAKDPYAAIIREALVAAAKAKGKKLPKADSDEYKALVGKFREAKQDWLVAELERRKAAVAGDDFDIEL
jgi:hypothetical protein